MSKACQQWNLMKRILRKSKIKHMASYKQCNVNTFMLFPHMNILLYMHLPTHICTYLYIYATAGIYQLLSPPTAHYIREYVYIHCSKCSYFYVVCVCVCVFGIFLVVGSSSGSNMLECCRCQLHGICFSATLLLSATINIIVFIVVSLVASDTFYALSLY